MRIALLCGIGVGCLLGADSTKVEVPSEILARLSKDLRLDRSDVECIRKAGGIGSVVSAKPIEVAPNMRALVVQGYVCLAGNYNAPLLLYARRPGSQWQLLMRGNGETVEAVGSRDMRFKDVVYSTDAAGGKTTRIRYSFYGGRYRPMSCDTSEWDKKLRCDSDWKSHYPGGCTKVCVNVLRDT